MQAAAATNEQLLGFEGDTQHQEPPQAVALAGFEHLHDDGQTPDMQHNGPPSIDVSNSPGVYDDTGRLQMVQILRKRGIEYGGRKDIDQLRGLLIKSDAAMGGDDDEDC